MAMSSSVQMTGTWRVDSVVAQQALGTAAEPGESTMNADARSAPRWSTSSFGDAPDFSPMELASLGCRQTIYVEHSQPHTHRRRPARRRLCRDHEGMAH